ncbi:hypothetical protein [Paenibacillus sp. JJ-100]|uniref:hypothetical protein n=1 Tax=Paenibacillus sp. JJ-100 TaxID=2974896 RepID=UPI00232BC1A1|nr:hypothetical protein [Paenibacillus sp. JJ-100]
MAELSIYDKTSKTTKISNDIKVGIFNKAKSLIYRAFFYVAKIVLLKNEQKSQTL